MIGMGPKLDNAGGQFVADFQAVTAICGVNNGKLIDKS
jgi:hypothetical protein